MHLFLLGVSHRTTPVELRERLDFATRGVDAALSALAARPAASEAVVLSTCNRAEIYVACDEVAAARTDLLAFLGEYHGVAAPDLAPHLYERADAEAARHLFRVAGGLDSLVIGEPQILGQVKEAFSAATEAGTAGPVLNKVFPWSFTVGKRVRTETALSEGAVSVSFAATALARKIFGDLDRADRPGDRRGRDGQADRPAPEGAGRRADAHHQPDARARRRAGRVDRRRAPCPGPS